MQFDIAMLILLLALQAASQPDIELRATVRARSLIVEKAGDAGVSVTADGRNLVFVEGPRANGRKLIANPVYRVNIEGRIANPLAAVDQPPPRSN